MSKETKIEIKSLTIEGRNAVLEAFRSGKPVDKLFVLDGCQDGPVRTIVREAKKQRYDLKFRFVRKELDQLSETGKHQESLRMQRLMNILRLKICLHLQKREGKIHFSFCLIISRIRTILEQSSVQPILPVHMG